MMHADRHYSPVGTLRDAISEDSCYLLSDEDDDVQHCYTINVNVYSGSSTEDLSDLHARFGCTIKALLTQNFTRPRAKTLS